MASSVVPMCATVRSPWDRAWATIAAALSRLRRGASRGIASITILIMSTPFAASSSTAVSASAADATVTATCGTMYHSIHQGANSRTLAIG